MRPSPSTASVLPRSVVDLTTLPGIGSNPNREDYIDRITGGLDAEWLTGARQSLDVDLDADYNRYFKNQDLNYVSSNDRVAWNWGLGDALFKGLVHVALPRRRRCKA